MTVILKGQRYAQNYEQEYDTVEKALDAACGDIEFNESYPLEILKDGIVVFDRKAIEKENEKRRIEK